MAGRIKGFGKVRDVGWGSACLSDPSLLHLGKVCMEEPGPLFVETVSAREGRVPASFKEVYVHPTFKKLLLSHTNTKKLNTFLKITC